MVSKSCQPRKNSAVLSVSSFDANRFLDEEGQRRFENCFSTKKLILERTMVLGDFQFTNFFTWLDRRDLYTLCNVDGEVSNYKLG